MKNILCVCIGNSDRSPVIAAVMQMLLRNANHKVTCESAGVGENAAEPGPAAPFAVTAAKRIGVDLSNHKRRHIGQIDISKYDLVICVTDDVAAQTMKAGVPMEKVYTLGITSPWPFKFQVDYDQTFEALLGAAYRVIARYFGD